MADFIKKVKIRKQDGTYTDYIPIGADGKNVIMSTEKNLEQTIGTIDTDTDGSIAEQLEECKNLFTGKKIANNIITNNLESKNTIYIRNDNYFDNDGKSTTPDVPYVTTDGMLNIFDGHLKLFADMDGDGDYDADLFSKDNMYLSCGSNLHLIRGQLDDLTKTENYGRIVIAGTENTNYIQTGKDYAGNESKHLAFSNYRSTDYFMIFNKNTGFTGVGKYYSNPKARLHVCSDENTLGIFENHMGTNARISFKGTNTTENIECTIGCENNDLILRAGNEARLRCIAETKHVLPGIASTINLGSSSYPWKDIFSVNSVTVTSDRRKKKEINSIDEKVFEAWSHIEYKQYKLKDENDKLHFGVIAQDIIEEFEKVGLNALDYGLVIYDKENDIYNVRYDEVNILENAYIRYSLKNKNTIYN